MSLCVSVLESILHSYQPFSLVWKAHLGLIGMTEIPSPTVVVRAEESGEPGCTRWDAFPIDVSIT